MKAVKKNWFDEEHILRSLITTLIGFATAALLWIYFKPPFGKNIVRLNTDERVVALTFDDGPNPPYTDRLLDILAEHNVKATFFMIGNRIEKYPETLQRAIAEGHQIGNHSYSHPVLGFCPPAYIQREIERTDDLLRQAGVTDELVIRAPILTRFLPVAWVLAKGNRAHISCNVWSWDWTTQNPDKITETVLKKTKPGSIIVLHDGKAENKDADRSGTVEATDQIITRLKQDGYRFVRLSDVGNQ
ncbi:polysaccharide deacetylase family protein [Candidatus Poribacteria bacterium]|nr:polysaccharide deacetylase family protein [Candidatus Poribacteria bacterium]MYK19131.1 polysaccharide deacetylase family protein [Candidatus Poribacteria bacterium]